MVSFSEEDWGGLLYTHPGFCEVLMEVVNRFYIKEKDEWSLKIRWVREKDKRPLTKYYRIKMTSQKWKEFKRVRGEL